MAVQKSSPQRSSKKASQAEVNKILAEFFKKSTVYMEEARREVHAKYPHLFKSS